ncbi:MAG: LamG-like jellyroll fold domain-containing protein [Planctomycetia bacterium]|nr:LamG-like jellyroll fold domain-containing protein [Planctomycetia bacterium]
MKKLFAVLMVSFCLPCLAEEKGDVLQSFRLPAWDTLELVRSDKEIRVVTKETKKTVLTFFALNRDKTPDLGAKIDQDGLEIDATKMKSSDMGNLTVHIPLPDFKKMLDHEYCMYIVTQGPKGSTGRYFYEGRSAADTHYYKALYVNFNGGKQTIPFNQVLDEGLRNLFLRYDYSQPGVYRFFDIRLELDEVSAIDMVPGKPELTFYVPFDGTAEAKIASGEKTPKKAEKLVYQDGILGQAAQFSRSLNNRLEYSLDKNLNPERGAISAWVKLDWEQKADGTKLAGGEWRTILSMPWQQETRIGSGAIWLWFYEGKFRGDTSDIADKYLTTAFPHDTSWHHVVFCWNDFGKVCYIDGKKVGRLSDSLNLAQPRNRTQRYCRLPFDSFFVGNLNWNALEGWIDELKIYSEPLLASDVEALYREFRTLKLISGDRYYFNDAPLTISGYVENMSDNVEKVSLHLTDAKGNNIQEEIELSCGKGRTPFTFSRDELPAGTYQITLSSNGMKIADDNIWVWDGKTTTDVASQPISGNRWNRELKRKLVEKIDPTTLGKDRLVSVGTLKVSEQNGKKYLETEAVAGHRFAVLLKFPEPGQKQYCIEYDFPDNACRTVDVVAQSAKGGNSEYELQVGYLTGDEYPNTGKMITQSYLYWPRNEDVALIFMCARNTQAGAAVGEIRVYEVEGPLPEASVHPARPVNGWTRNVGIYFEDPAIGYDFGLVKDGFEAQNFETMLNRICDYMKFSGQNTLQYPLVWYNGAIGDRYMPRTHAKRYFEGFLKKFDREGLEFMGTINQNNIDFEVPPVTRKDIKEGNLYNSVFTIHSTGTPHPGGWHGTPPNFNPLHPDVQAMTLRYFDEIIAIGKEHPSFKGIVLHLPKHALHSFGDIHAGYNDYMIEGFEKDTGIQVDVDKTDPKRGKRYYEWLMANAKEPWVEWRCRKLAEWYKVLAKKLSDARPDLKLVVNAFIPIIYEHKADEYVNEKDYWDEVNRYAGIDAKYFKEVPNMVIEQTVFPADYRWMLDRYPKERREHLRFAEERIGMYASLLRGDTAWIHHHDRYWESAIGREKEINDKPNVLLADWIQEHPWRVTTLNPAGFYAMKHYVMPLKYKDVQSITKGGFLIGSYGMEEYLVPFIAAFRALPAVAFSDRPESTDDVKVRQYTNGRNTWFYCVNCSDKPQTVTVKCPTKQVIDLGRWVRVNLKGDFRVTLQPYQLRSFRY